MTKGHIILLVSAIIGVFCMVHLWRRDVPVWKRLVWTPILFLPAIGPLLYGGMFEAPPSQGGAAEM